MDDIETKYPLPTNLSDFFNNSQSEFPFTAVSFKNILPWLPAELSDYFSNGGLYITELRLWNVGLKAEDYSKENENILRSYDLTPILSNVENLISLTLKRGTGFRTTRWVVPFEKLENIQYVDFERCTLDLKTNPLIIISPRDLRLHDVIFLQNSKLIKNVLLNDFVNFDEMETLDIYETTETIRTKIALDVSGREVLKTARLKGINLVSFENSGWHIGELTMTKVPFEKPTKMIVKQLTIRFSKCILKIFPISLQTLCILHCDIVDTTERETIWNNMPLSNIKRLDLLGSAAIKNVFPYFTRYFHNLEKLVLDAMVSVYIDASLIPPNVKSLTLSGYYNFVGHSHNVYALDKLHMDDYCTDMDYALSTLRRFNPRHFRLLRKHLLQPDDPKVKALLNTSTPSMDLQFFDSNGFNHLQKNCAFSCINNEKSLGIIVNGKGSRITIRHSNLY